MTDYSDPAAEKMLKDVALSNGFNAWLGLRLIAAGQGQCEIECAITEHMRQHHGFAHGGVVGALADIAVSWAAATAAGDVVTANYSLHLVSPARGDLLRARAVTLKQGSRAATVEGRVFSLSAAGEEKLAAICLASISILQEKAG